MKSLTIPPPFAVLAISVVVFASGCATLDESRDIVPPTHEESLIEEAPGNAPTEGQAQLTQGPPVTIDFQCGQISILATYQLRLDTELSNSGHGEQGRQAQAEMLNDLWATAADGDTPITEHLRAVQNSLDKGDRAQFDSAYERAAKACAANGSGIVMKFLPGEGG